MAIEDAFVLCNLIGNVGKAEDLNKAFKAYEKVRIERTHKLVETSREAGEIWEMEHPETGSDGKKIAENLAKRWLWIWDEDLDAEVEEGLKLMKQ